MSEPVASAHAVDGRPPRSVVLIPAHNRRQVTLCCLGVLHARGVFSWARVVVIDDGSTDGTGELIANEFPMVEVLRGNGDLWWTGAMRLGMEHALRESEGGPEVLIWLNDDCQPEAGALELLARMAVERKAICGGVSRSDSGHHLIYSGGLMLGCWPVPFREVLSVEMNCDWLHGNMVAIPVEVCRRIGLPDGQGVPHNWGDIEYTYRAARHGVAVLVIPGARARSGPNAGLLVGGWFDPRVSVADLWRGLWDRKAWWYAPAVVSFLVESFGWWCLGRLLILGGKWLGAVVFKLLLPREAQRKFLQMRGLSGED